MTQPASTSAPTETQISGPAAPEHAPPPSVMDALMGEQPHKPENLGKSAPPENIAEVLHWDPFNPPKEPAKAESTTPPAPPKAPEAAPPAAAKPEPKGQEPPPVVAPSTPPAVPDPRDQVIQQLQREMAVMRQSMQAVLTKTAEGGEAPASPAAEKVDIPQSYAHIRIPDQLMAQIRSEDPAIAATGLAALVQGTAAIIHREAILAARKEMQSIAANTASTVVDSATTAEKISKDYYSSFPQHSHFKDLVVRATEEVFRETGLRGWSEHAKLLIGNRVNQYFQSAGYVPASAAAAPSAPGPVAPAPPLVPSAATVSTPPKAPVVFAGNASPGVVGPYGTDPNSPDGIRRALFGG